MMIEQRQQLILEKLAEKHNKKIKELAAFLHVSEPTVRRDFTELHNRGLITKVYGGAILRSESGSADREIPFFLREREKSKSKVIIGRKAASLVKNGAVVMLDGSTSAYHIVPYLSKIKDIIVITSGAKTAVELAKAKINTFCTGGYMLIRSFSYVGRPAEDFVRGVNADILFFSCHGLDMQGQMSDLAIEEADLRRVMFQSCKKKYLLCDSTKFGKTYLHNMGNIREIDGIITECELPDEIAKIFDSESV